VAVPNLTDTWKVVYQMHAGLEHIENVVHVTYPTLGSPVTLANRMAAAWTGPSSISSRISNQITFDNIVVQPYDGVSAPFVESPAGYTGSFAGLGLVPTGMNAAQIITLRTLVSGRAARGRIYVAGVGGTDIANNGTSIQPAKVALNQTAADNWFAAINSGSPSVILVVYSRKNNTKANVSAVIARPYLGTQRGRVNAAMHP
jgi:hypothetical protein